MVLNRDASSPVAERSEPAPGPVPPREVPRRKVALVGLLLIAFAVWPLLHHVVAKRYFVSPWRLFGWAMYCVPVYHPKVQVFVTQQDQRLEIPFPTSQPDDVRALSRFVRYRAELGTLVKPDNLGHIVFREYPHLDEVTIHVIQPVFHYESHRIRHAYFDYRLERINRPTPLGEP